MSTNDKKIQKQATSENAPVPVFAFRSIFSSLNLKLVDLLADFVD